MVGNGQARLISRRLFLRRQTLSTGSSPAAKGFAASQRGAAIFCSMFKAQDAFSCANHHPAALGRNKSQPVLAHHSLARNPISVA